MVQLPTEIDPNEIFHPVYPEQRFTSQTVPLTSFRFSQHYQYQDLNYCQRVSGIEVIKDGITYELDDPELGNFMLVEEVNLYKY